MVGDNKVLTARCRWYGTASVSAECQYSVNCVGNRCGSHGVCRVKATPTVVHLNEYTCELKSTARVVAHQLPSTMLGTCSRMPVSPRKLSPMSVMCSACRVSSVTAESRWGNLQNDIRGQTARALRNESNQATDDASSRQTAPGRAVAAVFARHTFCGVRLRIRGDDSSMDQTGRSVSLK